ncbi:PqiC family protein [Ralstonia sp. 25C]|uniref:PqiC family protein n=1 Tax=Ralstonia sp. 25C TaxID=3447363 RepID=UPI003F74FAB0
MTRANMTTMTLSSLRLAGALAATALMAACASPEPTLHTLSVRPAATNAERFLRAFRLAGVRVPDRLDKPQIVLRTSDSEVQALEQQRWASPFGSELRDALSAQLAGALSAVDVGGGVVPAGVPLYRITADMPSYDARPGQSVAALVAWRVTRDAATPGSAGAPGMPGTGGAPALACQTTLTAPVAADASASVDPVVSSTQQVVQQWSAQIAQSVLALESHASAPAGCR